VVIQAKVGDIVDFAVEGEVPGAFAADNDSGILVIELVRSDINYEFLQLEPCVALTMALPKHIKRAAAFVNLKILRQQK
jgi:hypothetical protein